MYTTYFNSSGRIKNISPRIYVCMNSRKIDCVIWCKFMVVKYKVKCTYLYVTVVELTSGGENVCSYYYYVLAKFNLKTVVWMEPRTLRCNVKVGERDCTKPQSNNFSSLPFQKSRQFNLRNVKVWCCLLYLYTTYCLCRRCEFDELSTICGWKSVATTISLKVSKKKNKKVEIVAFVSWNEGAENKRRIVNAIFVRWGVVGGVLLAAKLRVMIYGGDLISATGVSRRRLRGWVWL